MKNLITFFLLFVSTLTFCQERVTSILSETTNARYFVEVIDEVKYLLEIDQNSELEVSILNEDFSLTFLHSRVIVGLFKDYSIPFDGNLLYALDDTKPLIYDFVNNTEIVVNMPSEWIPRYWRYGNGELAIIRCSDIENDEYRNFLVNVEGDIISSDESVQDILYIYGHYYYKPTPFISSDVRTYYLEHIETGVKDTIMSEVPRSILTTHGDSITYMDGDGRINTMNTITEERNIIPNLLFDIEKIFGLKVIEDRLFVRKSITPGRQVIQMYELSSGSFLKTFDHDDLDYFRINNVSIAQNKLIVLTSWYIITFDLSTGEGTRYLSDYNEVEVPTIDDRYIFNTNHWQSTFIDLKAGEESVISGEYEIRPYDYAKIIDLGDIHLGIFRADGLNLRSMYELDVANNSIQHAISIDNTNEGFDDYYTELIKIGGDLILASNDIYSVDDLDVTKINPYEIKEVDQKPFRKTREYVSFLCKDDLERQILYTYNGQDLNEEAVFEAPSSPSSQDQLTIQDYIITTDNVFYNDSDFFGGGLKRYNKSTGEITEIAFLQSISFFSIFTKSGEDVYYMDNNELFHIDTEGEITNLKKNSSINIFFPLTIEHNGKCYNLDNDAISLLEGKELIPILLGDFQFGFGIISQDLTSSSIMIQLSNDNYKKAIYLNGQDAYLLELEKKISSIRSCDNDHFLIYSYNNDTEESEYFVFNGVSKELYNLSELSLGDHYFDLFFVGGIPFVMTRNFVTNKLYIYQLTEDYSSSSLLYESNFFLGSSDARFKAFENEGLLYADELIALMDEDFSLHPIDVKGNGRMNEMEESKEGYLYFMGSDVDYGNQLYRVQRFSFRVGTEDLRPIIELSIYPNPAEDLVQLNEEIKEGDFTILDNFGRIVQIGKMNSKFISINTLNSGLYFLKVENENTIYVASFYKNKHKY